MRARLGLVFGVLGLVACKTEIIEVEDTATVSPGAGEQDQLAEREAVREAVTRYVAALAARDPVAAAAAVVPETFAYYEDLRIAALRASREQLESWGLMSVVLILEIRRRTSRGALEQLDGRALFERAVGEGMAAEPVALDDVWIAETGDRAEIRIDAEPVLWLRKLAVDGERREWRLDFPTMITQLEPRFEALARAQLGPELDERVRMAYVLIELNGIESADLAILDGPLEHVPGEAGSDDVAP